MEPFPVTRIARITEGDAAPSWLVESLWGDQAVGFIAGTPKAGKTWLALDLAVAVASGQPCLGRYPVHQRGPVLLYAAEDTAPAVRQRVVSIAAGRGIGDIARLPLGLITAPALRLDHPEHQERLKLTVAQVKPRLLVLDPLVRLHHADENSAADISLLLGFLRQLQREHSVAIILVHHVRKSGSAQPGQALRGSGDLHAWSDSNLYLLHKQGRTELHIEHRAHPASSPVDVALRCDAPVHLEVLVESDDGEEDSAAAEPLTDRVMQALAAQSMTRQVLRQLLRVRNERLGQALTDLERSGKIRRSDGLYVPVPHP